MTRKLLTVAGLVLTLCATAAADEKHGGLCFTLPEGWHSTLKKAVRTVNSPDEKITVTMTPVVADDVDAAFKALDKELADVVEDLDVTQVTRTTVNDLETVYFKGTTVSGEEPVRVTAAIVDAGDHCLIVVATGSEESIEKYGKVMKGMFKSIRRPETEQVSDGR